MIIFSIIYKFLGIIVIGTAVFAILEAFFEDTKESTLIFVTIMITVLLISIYYSV
jgi:hypothetical protein